MSRINELRKKFGNPDQLDKTPKEEPKTFIPFTKKREDLPIDDNRFLAHFFRTGTKLINEKRDTKETIEYDVGSEANMERLKKLILKFNTEEPFNQFLVISGRHGSGKTTLFQILARMLYGRPQGFSIQQSNRLNDLALKNGYFDGLKFYENIRLCINDFGFEDSSVKHYGNELNALDKLVYNRWEVQGLATHFTTNLQVKEDFLNQFSKRTRERINHNMIFVALNESDFRKQNKE